MLGEDQKVVYVIGGPNGAGKTSFAKEFLPRVNVLEFLNADLLALGLSPLRPESMTVRSGRLLLTRWKEIVESGSSFAFESTLSGRSYVRLLKWAADMGYSVRICYLWLPSIKLSYQRVRQRVRKGGHDVPEDVLRRRFLPSLSNFFTLYLPLADEAVLFSAATIPPKVVTRWWSGIEEVIAPSLYEKAKRKVKNQKAN